MKKCLTPSSCHPRRITFANGLCRSCYDKTRKDKKRPACHPDNTYHSNELCTSCYYKKNQDKRRDSHKRYIDNHPEYNKNYIREWMYTLTPEQYQDKISKQDGLCAVCRTKPCDHVDHDHKCCAGDKSCGDCVRGILCSDCNRGLGSFHDKPEFLNNAILYLKTWAEHLEEINRKEYNNLMEITDSYGNATYEPIT